MTQLSSHEILMRVECARPACSKLTFRFFEERVPWFMAALPVLRVHVRHGSCPLRVSLDGVVHVGLPLVEEEGGVSHG